MAHAAPQPEFPIDEWEKVPQYWGPGSRELQEFGRVTVLDFERLSMIAEVQRDRGAFKPGNSTDVELAPVKVGVFPGSFVSVESLWEEDYSLHHSFEAEILVVLSGILEVERSLPPDVQRLSAPPKGFLRQGDVVALRPGDVQLTAHGLAHRASSLALSIYGLTNRQAHFIITQSRYTMRKEFDADFKPKLPYNPKKEQNE